MTNVWDTSQARTGTLALRLILAALALLLPRLAAAQTVEGVVTAEGAPVPFATVRLAETERGAAADAEGAYRLALPEAGPFALLVSAIGYEAARVEGIAEAGETVRLDVALEAVAIQAREVVVAASRRAQALEDVPVPTTIVSREVIDETGALRLSDALEDVPGVVLADGFGAGVQLQGLDPDYTLILIDGEPVVGRTAGVLDLSRISLAGVERVEVVRGPSSSLYGSEALAGVINIVTRVPDGPPSGAFRARYGSFGTATLTGEVSGGTTVAGREIGARLVVDGYGSDGYDLDPDAYGQTTPAFTDGTADLRVRAALSSATDLTLGARAGRGDQTQSYLFEDILGAFDEIDQTETRTDWSVRAALRHALSDRFVARGSAYATGYRLETDVRRRETGEQTYDDLFDQRLARGEAQFDALWSVRHRTLTGGGVSHDALLGDRYGATGSDPRATTLFAFAQHEWAPSRLLDLSASARFDTHSDAGSRLSPKLAALVRPRDGLRLRASVGSGFKAPDPRQLYLTFTNNVGGYQIFGAARVADGLDRLEAENRLACRYLDVGILEAITPETSLSFDAEIEAELLSNLSATVGAFRTDVDGLIDVQPVAELADGGPVYSYVNLGRVRTEGVTAQIRATPANWAALNVGYQLLRSRDRDVADAIREGSVFGRTVTGRDVRLTLSDYANLFGRSTHTLTARVSLRPGAGTSASAILRARSRYGLRDLDGNAIANRDDEFVPATALLDLTLAREWALAGQTLTTQLGVENVFGTTRPVLVPSLPGRRAWASVALRF